MFFTLEVEELPQLEFSIHKTFLPPLLDFLLLDVAQHDRFQVIKAPVSRPIESTVI